MNKKHIYPLLIISVVILLISNLFLLTRNYSTIHSRGGFASHRNEPPLIDRVGKIEPWMTFDFINHSFNLPDAYLRDQFTITNKMYPRVTIARVAKTNNTNLLLLLAQVKASVTTYLQSATSTNLKP